jgi:hypothetical protein
MKSKFFFAYVGLKNSRTVQEIKTRIFIALLFKFYQFGFKAIIIKKIEDSCFQFKNRNFQESGICAKN